MGLDIGSIAVAVVVATEAVDSSEPAGSLGLLEGAGSYNPAGFGKNYHNLVVEPEQAEVELERAVELFVAALAVASVQHLD